jgi:hypothetical protein
VLNIDRVLILTKLEIKAVILNADENLVLLKLESSVILNLYC